MSEYEHNERRLPPAKLSTSEFREIENALSPEYKAEKAAIRWEFFRGNRNNSATDLDEVLGEIADKPDVDGFQVLAEDEDSEIRVYGSNAGCFLEYDAPAPRVGDIRGKVHRIEGIFRDHRHVTAYIPLNNRPFLRKPRLLVGPPKRKLGLSWNAIIEGVVTRWIAAVITAPLTFGLGVLTGWLVL